MAQAKGIQLKPYHYCHRFQAKERVRYASRHYTFPQDEANVHPLKGGHGSRHSRPCTPEYLSAQLSAGRESVPPSGTGRKSTLYRQTTQSRESPSSHSRSQPGSSKAQFSSNRCKDSFPLGLGTWTTMPYCLARSHLSLQVDISVDH